MEKIDTGLAQALQWLRYVLNPDTEAPVVSDWAAIYGFARKQALLGICAPQVHQESIPQLILFDWIRQLRRIEYHNNLINTRIGEVFGMLEQDGFACCLLKGQGNAVKYPDPLRRTPGDIDIWVDTGPEDVCRYVQSKFPEEKVSFKHIHFPIFSDVKVDVHVTPLKLYDRRSRKRLQRWIESHKEEQFAHQVSLSGIERTVSVPTDAFNAVYQLGHMLIHLFDEGLGLRQVVDYFYVLKSLSRDLAERSRIAGTIKELGMLRFARAMMWVEREVLGLPPSDCVVEPDGRLGKKILDDMMEGGNFGLHTRRYKGKRGFFSRGTVSAGRIMSLFSVCPRESSAILLRKMGTIVRRAFRGRKG